MELTTATLTMANAPWFSEGMQIIVSGTSGRDMPRWVMRKPFQDGDRALVQWLCWVLFAWRFNLNGAFKIRRVVNRTTLQISAKEKAQP
jgi:hypothetical protein